MSTPISVQDVHELAKNISPKIQAIRHHLHAHPELSFLEFETSDFIAQQLQEWGIPFKQGIAGTGLIAEIKGLDPESKIIALRADIDALPIQETNEVPYKSQNPGLMHACGHDVHTSSLLGAIYILNQVKDKFTGTVRCLFQPGEEKAPGGASLMIKEGALENPKPKAIVGQHVMPQIPVGKVGFRKGIYMASADEIYLTVKGKGGHAAMPEINIDPVLITAHILVALQQIVSRNASPKIPSVLSFGKVEAKGATNVIPNEVKVEGTFRTMNEVWRTDAKVKIKKMAEGIAEAMGGTCEVHIMDGYPYLENHPELTDKMRTAAEAYLGKDQVVDLDLWMAAEDFAFYSHVTDACFYRLGVRNEEKGIISPVHTSTFDIDEDALEIGCGLMSWLALEALQNHTTLS